MRSFWLPFFIVLLGLPTLVGAVDSTANEETKKLEKYLLAHPEQIHTRELLGREFLKIKNFEKAISTLAPYSNEISNNSLIELAFAYGENKDSLNEIRTLTQLSEKDPNHFRPYFLLGLSFKKANKPVDAAKNLRKSIDLAPSHKPSYDALLEIFIAAKQNYESRMLVSEMIQQFGPKKELLAAQCKLFAVDGFLKEASVSCKKAVSADPKTPENHIYLAQAYYDQNNAPAAEKIFTTAARQFKSSEFVQYASGQFYFTEKNYPTAVRYLTEAVKINPEALRSQLTLANALFESKQYSDALTHFEKACKLDKSKESVTLIKNSAARLRKENRTSDAEKFELKAATCQG